MHNQRLRRKLESGLSEDEAYALIHTSSRNHDDSFSEPIAELKIEKVKERICEPVPPKAIQSLLLFKGGNQTEGRIASLYNLLASAKDAEVGSLTSLIKASQILTDPVHYCGFHTTINRQTLQGFCSRLWLSPNVLSMEPNWKDYLRFLLTNSRCHVLSLQRIREFDRQARRPWRMLYRIPLQPVAEFYPFITGKPTNDHDLILAVDSLVPKTIPSEVRADVCQDMIVAILTGETTLDNLRDSKAQFIKRVFRDTPSKYGHLSLDAPLIYGDSKSRTLGETIV